MIIAPTKAWLGYAAAGLLAAAGCRACSDCYDYSSPVADPVYGTTHGRAGSNLSGGVVGASWQPATAAADHDELFSPSAEQQGAEEAVPAGYADDVPQPLPDSELAPLTPTSDVMAPAPSIAAEPLP